MFLNTVEFEDIVIKVDGFHKNRNLGNVLPILYEEQPVTWELLRDEIAKIISKKAKILDVGTGSGIWALLIKKTFPDCNVTAIDKNPKSIQTAKQNFHKNRVEINLKKIVYALDSFTKASQDLIVLTPPYHIYPPETESNIPFFARGGYDGQMEFKSQMSIATHHLKENGKILFNMMCLGNKQPEFCIYLPKLFNSPISINYFEILPNIKSEEFLYGVYGNTYPKFQLDLSKNYENLFYTCGYIEYSQKLKIKRLEHSIKIDRSWQDRVLLHQEINCFHNGKDKSDL